MTPTSNNNMDQPDTPDTPSPDRLIPEDSRKELTTFFANLKDPVRLAVFTAKEATDPASDIMLRLIGELAELSDKLELTHHDLNAPEAAKFGVDFSPTLLIAPEKYDIRYLGAPLGEEAKGLIEVILRVSLGKSGLGKVARDLLATLTEKRRVTVFVNPACPYCPGQVINAFRAAIERPDLVAATCVDTTQHPALAKARGVGSVPHTVVNDVLDTLGLEPEERFAAELVTLKSAEALAAEANPEAMRATEVDCLVIGSGPAGLTAGIYAVRSGLSALILERGIVGGQVAVTPTVENYPGFASVSGRELVDRMAEQTRRYCEIREGEAALDIKIGKRIEVLTPRGIYLARTLILATGATWKKLGVPGEDRYAGSGVSNCASCDGFLFKGGKVVVVGGGNTALTDALHLTNLGVGVTIVHRRDAFRAEKHLAEAVAAAGIPVIWNAAVAEITGGGDGKVDGVRLKNLADGSEFRLDCQGVFVAVGLSPNTALAEDIGLTLTPEGFIKVDAAMRANIPRVYAAGDLIGGIMQIVTAVGQGATAALSAFEDVTRPYWKKRGPA